MPHPYIGVNSKQYHWVDEKVWYYRKRFAVTAQQLRRQAILCCDGIAYYARLWLNGILLGDHEGMFGGRSLPSATSCGKGRTTS
jgi:beta-mannosidase